jgi:hypothetical protein
MTTTTLNAKASALARDGDGRLVGGLFSGLWHWTWRTLTAKDGEPDTNGVLYLTMDDAKSGLLTAKEWRLTT